MIAKTLQGLEEVLATELQNLGASDIEIGRRMVSFSGDQRLLYKANIWLRTALRILKPVFTCKASNPDELYEQLVSKDWSQVMSACNTFSIDTTIYSEGFSHSKYVGYRTKDAIVDFFRHKEGSRPSVRIDNPDIPINVHIAHNEVTVSLDSSGDSLHKRGYRAVQTEAPINEVLAAGILLMAGWQGQSDLIDPMCGSGTFLIEAGLIARNIPPGIYRTRGFAFERWGDFDKTLFEELYNDDHEEREFEHKIYGSDMLRQAVSISQQNVDRAGLSKNISLEVIPMENRPAPVEPAMVVMNPPYGERLKLRDAGEVYTMIGERLKHNYPGCNAWIIAYNIEHFDHIGLRPLKRVKLMNGSLECELRGYELFAGKRDEYKTREREHRGEHPAERRERRPRREGFERPRRELGGRDRQREGGRPERRGGGAFAPDRGRFASERGERPERRTPVRDRRTRDTDRPAWADRGERRNDRPAFGERRDRPARPAARPEGRDGARPRREQKPSWPNSRFKYVGEDGVERFRKPRTTSFQVYRADDED